ncbi:hypothetical protein WR25_15367 isoform A [Diploscapter pachys]|uniref:BED-type domain-containing protein n=1 Tax=Diploscapter pachys TaxID=2018661 RepID=A0A2A2L6C7_9BILA|nr:hypothetical protein WR25_15367 isoform A [Diploscapter pachys]
MQSKFVVVEVANTQSTMTLVEYLVTHGYDKFAVVTDLSDHPSLKYKQNGAKKLRKGISINDIASALQKKSVSNVQQSIMGMNVSLPNSANSTPQKNDANIQNLISTINNAQQQQLQQQQAAALSITRLLEEKNREMEARKEHDRQREQIQRIIMAQAAALNNPFGTPPNNNRRSEPETRISPELNEDEIALASETISKAGSDDIKAEIMDENCDGDQGVNSNGSPSDEQVRASMIHLLNPVLGSAFGSSLFDENRGIKREAAKDESAPTHPTPTKKHRWLPADELEESRNGRSKAYGRVHCKATYKCALCGKPTTLNSTGSRWNLLRHVIMIHSESKPYKY